MGRSANNQSVDRREFEAGETLIETELTPMEFVELAKSEEWDPHTVALLVRAPMMMTPFQCGRWRVTLVDQ